MTPLDPRELKGAQFDLLGPWTGREEACPDWGCLCPDRPLLCPDRPLVRPDRPRTRTDPDRHLDHCLGCRSVWGGVFSDGAVACGLKVSKPKGPKSLIQRGRRTLILGSSKWTSTTTCTPR